MEEEEENEEEEEEEVKTGESITRDSFKEKVDHFTHNYKKCFQSSARARAHALARSRSSTD